MARTSTNDHSSAAGETSLHSSILDQSNNLTTAQNIVISPMGLDEVPVPGNAFISNAVMTQEGSDLILESPDGVTMVIEGYFSSDTPPNLISSDGKVMTPALVKSFIQASTDFAEDKTAMNDATPIGEAIEVLGNVSVTRADGTKETVAKGTHIFEGDIIETDKEGAVNIEFADESSFAVSSNAKMAVDEFVFDTTTNGGENKFSVLRGLFVYTSGLVGREDPDDVHINTPVGSIGIRGTIITGDIPADGEDRPASISVVEGAIVINSVTGTEVILSKHLETVHIDTKAQTTENVGVLAQSDMSETFNVLRTVAPTLFSTIEEGAAPDAPVVEEAPVEALPTEAAPAETPAEPEPEAQPAPEAPIQLNLMNDLLAPTLEDKTRTLATETPLEKLALFTADTGTIHIGTTPVTAPVVAPPVVEAHAPESPPGTIVLGPPPVLIDGGGTGTVDPPPPSNTPPSMNVAGGYHVVEQQGLLNNGSVVLYFNQFFSDNETRDAHDLVYTVTTLSAPYTVDHGPDGTNRAQEYFNVTGMPSGTSATFKFIVTASDGEFTSAPLTLEFTAYAATDGKSGTGPITSMDITNSFHMDHIVMVGSASNSITDEGNYNVMFGQLGGDNIVMNGNYGKAYGDSGTDTITIAGNGNLASGGVANDTIILSLNDNAFAFKAYGGRGNDTFFFNNADSFESLAYNSNSKIDGGEGTDILKFNAIDFSGTINLSLISERAKSVEKMMIMSTDADMSLSLNDIIKMSGDSNKFYIIGQGTENDIFIEKGSHSALTNMGVDGVYTKYGNGDITLYVQNVGDLSGTGVIA